MYELKLKCKVITPLFMYGADGVTPELRPSEFKGMMRWWWRAIMAENNIEKLKSEEESNFGGTSNKTGKSKVNVLLNNKKTIVAKNIKEDYQLIWSFDSENETLKGDHAGIGYLLYSTVLPKIEKKYIKTDSKFEIIIKSLDKYSFNAACASLWLAIYLGGFGTRARRGGGNIGIESVQLSKTENLDINSAIFVDYICDVKNLDDIVNFISSNLEKIKALLQRPKDTKKYTNLKEAQIIVFEPKNSWIEALNFIGEPFRYFRFINKNKLFDKPIFGMPIMHNKFTMRLVPYDSSSRLSDRWASPLIFKIVESNNLYFPMLVVLNYGGVEFVGKEQKSNFWNKAISKDIKQMNNNLLLDFINKMKKNKVGVINV